MPCKEHTAVTVKKELILKLKEKIRSEDRIVSISHIVNDLLEHYLEDPAQ